MRVEKVSWNYVTLSQIIFKLITDYNRELRTENWDLKIKN